MRIRYNEDAEVVARLRAALLKRDLQCPCRLQKIEDNVCMCKEFRDQIADPEFEGYLATCRPASLPLEYVCLHSFWLKRNK